MTQWNESAFKGGHPALDFLNTVADPGKTRRQSRIADWRSFAAWAEASSQFSQARLRALKSLAGTDRAEPLLADVHRLRETAHTVLKKLAAGSAPARDELAELEADLSAALGRASLTRSGSGYAWTAPGDSPGWIVDALRLFIEDFLRGEDVGRLRECGRCTWLFVDRGRGTGRRWCDMRTCGNRAKAEAFRTR